MVHGRTITVSTAGFSDIINISGEVQSTVSTSGIADGPLSGRRRPGDRLRLNQ